MTRTRSMRFTLVLLALLSLPFFSCKRQVAIAPPPPPPPIPITPVAAPLPPAPTITFTAQPATIEQGQSTTLTWATTNAATVSIEPEIGQVAINGNRQVTPAASVTYNATATGRGGTAGLPVRVTVNARTAAPPFPTTTGGGVTTPPVRPSATVDEIFTQNMLPILFEYDKAEIRTDQRPRLDAIVSWLRQTPSVRFTISGHADDRGSQEYNLALGDRRANTVASYLTDHGIDRSRMNVVSFGEERPVCVDPSEECYARNRRAAFAPDR